MTSFEVLDDGVWTPRCDLHRRFDPGTGVRAVGIEPERPAQKKSLGRQM
jgi:hypothetical protein